MGKSAHSLHLLNTTDELYAAIDALNEWDFIKKAARTFRNSCSDSTYESISELVKIFNKNLISNGKLAKHNEIKTSYDKYELLKYIESRYDIDFIIRHWIHNATR